MLRLGRGRPNVGAPMDLYFIVGELTFPGGVAEQWRAADLPPTAKRRQPTTLDAVLASAEGPVRLEVRDDTVSLRVYLIDSAYFMVKDELAASLEVARKLGARGEWYSGDHVAGQHAVLPHSAKRAALHTLKDVSAWTVEAAALGEDATEGASESKKPRKKPTKKTPQKGATKRGRTTGSGAK